MLLARRRLDGRDDLPRDAQLRERAERREFVGAEVADGLVEADHAFLDDILTVGTDEEVALGLDADEVLIFVEQELHGEIVATFRCIDEFFVRTLAVI